MSRSTNFTNCEIDLIVSELEEFPELVSKEYTKRLPGKKEHQFQWELIAKKLSAINMGIPRTGNQVRNKWNDLKYRIKQKSMKIKKQNSGTGGGPPKTENLLPYEQRIIGLIGKRCTEGITDEFSDTSTLVLQKLKKINTTSSPSQSQQPLTEVILTESDNVIPDKENDDICPHPTASVYVIPDKENDDICPHPTSSVYVIPDKENYGICPHPTSSVYVIPDKENDDICPHPTSSVYVIPDKENDDICPHPTSSVYVIPDKENDDICPHPTSSVYGNVQTPKSWPVQRSNNSSTLRGQLHRQRKRKRAASVLDSFETEALEMQRNTYKQIKELGDNVAVIVPILKTQQQDTSSIKEILMSMNKNIEKLVDKIDETNNLLKNVLNADK